MGMKSGAKSCGPIGGGWEWFVIFILNIVSTIVIAFYRGQRQVSWLVANKAGFKSVIIVDDGNMILRRNL